MSVIKHPKAARRQPPRPPAPKAEVIPIGAVTVLNIATDDVLRGAIGTLEGVVLMGFDKGGDVYLASSYADGGTVLWLMEKMREKLLQPYPQ